MKMPNVKYSDNNMIGVEVMYEPCGTTTIFKSNIKNLKEGMFVVVPTNTRWEMTVVRVEKVDVPFKSTCNSIISVVG